MVIFLRSQQNLAGLVMLFPTSEFVSKKIGLRSIFKGTSVFMSYLWLKHFCRSIVIGLFNLYFLDIDQYLS